MTLQDRLDELTTDRDRRFQEREFDRAEQVNGTDYNPIEVNPWTGQAGDVVSNGQIPPGMPITELQTSEGGRTIEGPNSPRPRPKPQPKKPYLEFKPIVIGYLATEEYTADDKLFSACYIPPGRVAVLFTVERDTGSPVDYACPRYEFQWREDGDAECRPTPDPNAPYDTMSECRNDPKNRVWQARDGTPLGVNQAQYPDEPPHEDYADKGGSSWLLISNEEPAYSYGLVTIFWKYKILIPGDSRNDGQWRLTHRTVDAGGSAPRLTALRLWMRDTGIEDESQISYHHLESVLAVSGDRYTSYYNRGSGYKTDAQGNFLIPNGTPASYTVVEWMQSQVRAPGSDKTNYGNPVRRSYRAQREFWRLGSGFSYSGWFPAGEGEYGGDPPPPNPLPIPEREVPARWKRPEEGEATTVARQYWVSELSNNPEIYKQPYNILEINAEDESIGYIAYDGIHAQGFIKYGRHLVGDEEQWCEVMQFGNKSPDPWNSGVGKSKDLNPPESLNRSACGKQFAESLGVNVSPSLGKVIEIDPNQLVRSITSTPTVPVQRPLDQELEIAVADSRMSNSDVRDIIVKVKVQNILPGSGCSLSPIQEKDAIVNRFMLQSLASTTTEIAPGYSIEDVPKSYAPIWGTNSPPSGGSKDGKRFYYYWRHSNGEETRVEIPVEILRTDPVKAYLTQVDDKSAIAVFKVGEKTEQGETEPKACRVIRAKISVDGDESSVSIEDFSIDTELLDVIEEDWQSSYTRDRLIEPEIPAAPEGTMVQWNIDNEQRGNLRIADSQAIALEGDKEDWVLGQALKIKVWEISDFSSGTAEEIESNFAPISDESVLIVAASAVLATSE